MFPSTHLLFYFLDMDILRCPRFSINLADRQRYIPHLVSADTDNTISIQQSTQVLIDIVNRNQWCPTFCNLLHTIFWPQRIAFQHVPHNVLHMCCSFECWQVFIDDSGIGDLTIFGPSNSSSVTPNSSVVEVAE